MTQKFAPEEVSKHNEEENLWIVIHGKVHDLTKFLKEHPGGEEVLINLAGQDGTKCFDDIGHSLEAKKLCETFEIGELEGSMDALKPMKKEATVDDDDWEYEEPKKESSPYLGIFLSLGVLVYGVLFYYIFY